MPAGDPPPRFFSGTSSDFSGVEQVTTSRRLTELLRRPADVRL